MRRFHLTSKTKFGVNINTRVPLIYPEHYDVDKLLDFAVLSEELGYHSVWVGDSILAKKRLDPLLALSAVASRTSRVKLGTCCLIVALRNPLLLARSWATLDRISHGRTLMGACIGPGKEEYLRLGLRPEKRGEMMEEAIVVMKKLWSGGPVDHRGTHYRVEGVSLEPVPVQKPHPPIYIVGWPYGDGQRIDKQQVDSVLSRVAREADGWMLDGGTTPELLRDGVERLRTLRGPREDGSAGMEVVYQPTLNLNDDPQKAQSEGNRYVERYYGSLKRPIGAFGPAGTPDDCIKWMESYIGAGVSTIVLRFASPDQFGQLKKFTKDVMPSFA